MSIFLLLLCTCAGALMFTFVGVILVHRLVRTGVAEGHNDVLAAIFQAGGTIYAVFLAFLVVAVWQAHDAAHANVADEASLLCTLYRGSEAMDAQTGANLRILVREYTQAVIGDEWKVQAKSGGASEAARSAGLRMFKVFSGEPPDLRRENQAIDTVQLGIIAQLQADRNKRTLQAEESISPVIWLAAVINGFIVVSMSFLLYADRNWPHIVMSGALAAMIAALLCVVFILERPFGGLMPLQPDAFAHSLQVYDSVDRTTSMTRLPSEASAPLRSR
jgi:hypothetical protein